MKTLIVTDLHLNMKDDDSYRWEFLDSLHETIDTYEADLLLVMGDLTHDKDNHSAALVNRVVDSLVPLSKMVEEGLLVIKGNHDYIDPAVPFMRFMNHIPTIRFIVEPFTHGKHTYLPHTRNPAAEWKRIKRNKYVYMHQTVTGARASNGMQLDGETIPEEIFKSGRLLSGDIHVPQTLGKVCYVGTPYHVHFGDNFTPRMAVLDDEKDRLEFIEVNWCPRKISLKITDPDQIDEHDIRKGDFVKVEISLPRYEFPYWKALRQTIKEKLDSLGARERGIGMKEVKRVKLKRPEKKTEDTGSKSSPTVSSDEEALDRYSKAEKVDSELRDFAGRYL